MSNVMIAVILGLWSGVSMVLNLSGLGVRTTVMTGLISGLVCGNVEMGLAIGAQMLIASLGFYTYGGATIPDFITGTLFGTVVGAKTGSAEAGIVISGGISLLMTQMDILGRASTTVFQHLCEGALAKNDIKMFEIYDLCGVLPWTLSRMIPTVVGLLLILIIVPSFSGCAQNTTSKSLNYYINKFKPNISYRISQNNFGQSENIKSIPLYAVFCIKKKT